MQAHPVKNELSAPRHDRKPFADLIPHTRGVENIAPSQLRAYMARHLESDYLLVDVRERDEYRASHIPGAKLIPLSELERRVGEIQDAKEPFRIFYCRSGGRSSRAAAFAGTTVGVANVFNLDGGILAYDGQTVPDFPRLKTFDTRGSLSDLLHRALDLEKGADRFYAALQPFFAGTAAQATIETLAQAEEAHGRSIYAALAKLSVDELEDFDTLYGALPGELLEDGRSYDEAVAHAEQMIAEHGASALLELALEIEYRSYDLYRQLAHQSEDEEERRLFLDLASQEKRHIEGVLRTFGKITSP